MITGAMRTTPTKVMEMLLDLPIHSIVVEAVTLISAYHLPRPDQEDLEIGQGIVWKKAERVDNKFAMAKDHTTPR